MESQIRQQRNIMSQLVLGMVKLSLSSVDPQRPVSAHLTGERKEQEINEMLILLHNSLP